MNHISTFSDPVVGANGEPWQAPESSSLPTSPTPRALELEQMSNAELDKVFLLGTMPSQAALSGWEFRGINVPGWAKVAGIKKFVKGFFDAGAGLLMGYNSPIKQGPLSEPWEMLPTAFAPKRFGYYVVEPVDATARDNAYLHAVLLNYGRGGNPRFDPTSGLRDYLVQVDPDNRDLYLGKAYYAVGPARLSTNFFILERKGRGVDRDPRVA
jgi:hypothetical protein